MSNPNYYPVNAFPILLRNVINALHEDTQMPLEMIASTLLAATSLALQPLIDVASPYDKSKNEPCSLYFLTLAKSGEGKSPLKERIMRPFDDFVAQMQAEYDELQEAYEQDHSIWSSKEKALNNHFQKVLTKGDDAKDEERRLREHQATKLTKPKRFEMFYEDATPEGITQGLQDHPYAGIFADEAITFFTGYLKNNLGLLNKIWKNEPISLSRKKEGTTRLNASLTFSLMVQPDVFNHYLEKNDRHSISTGFLARFLFTNTISTIETRKINLNQEKSEQALAPLFELFNQFFIKHKQHFYDRSLPKKTLHLSEDASKLFEKKINQYQSNITKNQCWEHIPEFVSKAGNNAIRIAAIFECKSEQEISEQGLNNAFSIVEWHLNQASQYFYILSPQYQLQQDVYALFDWMVVHFINPTGKFKFKNTINPTQEIALQPWQPFPKSELLQLAPSRLRKVERLNEVLEQLIGLDKITEIQYSHSSTVYIAVLAINKNINERVALNPSNTNYAQIEHPKSKEKLLNNYVSDRITWPLNEQKEFFR